MSEPRQLLEGLLAELEPMALEMVERTRVEIPSFSRVPADQHLRDTRSSVELLIRDALGSGSPRAGGGQLAELGARRAAQGVPVEDLLRAWRLSITVGTEHARRLAENLGLPAQSVIDLLQGALGSADDAMVPLVEGHRSAEAAALSERDEFVLAALDGSLVVEALRVRAVEYGLDVTRRYRALRARGEPRELAVIRSRLAEESGVAVGIFAEGDGWLVGMTCAEPQRAIEGPVAIGPSVRLENLAASDRIARRVLAAADRNGLAGVHDLRSAGLQVAVLESGDVGAAMVERYVEPVREIGSGAELIASVRAWLDAGMRVRQAAERLHIHENTMRYRLRRYAELTGADLALTEDMIGVWWALQRDALDSP